VGQGGEMTQALYAHMNKKKKPSALNPFKQNSNDYGNLPKLMCASPDLDWRRKCFFLGTSVL
jgi:hypothetical protein